MSQNSLLSGIPPAFNINDQGFVENPIEAMSRFRCIISRDDGEEFIVNGLSPPFANNYNLERIASERTTLTFEQVVIRSTQGVDVGTQIKYDSFVFPDGRSVITIYYNSAVFYRGVILDFEYSSNSLSMIVAPKTFPLATSNYKYTERDYSTYSNIYDILKVSLQRMGYTITDSEDRHKKYNHINIIANVSDIKKIKITTTNKEGLDLQYEEDISGVRVNAKTSTTVAGVAEKVGEFLIKIANQLGILLYTNPDGDIIVSRIDRLLEKIAQDNENNTNRGQAIVSAVIQPGEPELLDEYKPNIVLSGNQGQYKIRNGITGRYGTIEGVVKVVKVVKESNEDESLYGSLDVPPQIIVSKDDEVSELLHITNQVTNTLNPAIALRDQQQTALALKARQNIIQATLWGLAYDGAWNPNSTDFIKVNDVKEVIIIHPNHNDVQEYLLVQQVTHSIDKTQITTSVVLVSPNYYLNLSFNARTRPARFRRKIRKNATT